MGNLFSSDYKPIAKEVAPTKPVVERIEGVIGRVDMSKSHVGTYWYEIDGKWFVISISNPDFTKSYSVLLQGTSVIIMWTWKTSVDGKHRWCQIISAVRAIHHVQIKFYATKPYTLRGHGSNEEDVILICDEIVTVEPTKINGSYACLLIRHDNPYYEKWTQQLTESSSYQVKLRFCQAPNFYIIVGLTPCDDTS